MSLMTDPSQPEVRHGSFAGFMVGLVGLLMPYVMMEPAPVDALLILLAGAVLLTFALPLGVWLIFVTYFGLSQFALLWVTGQPATAPQGLPLRYLAIELYLALAMMGLFALFYTQPRLLQIWLRAYVYGAVLSCVALALILLAAPEMDLIYRDEFRLRIRGFFKDPNVLGTFLIFPGIVLIVTPREVGLPRWAGLVAGGLIGMMIYLTYSRAAAGFFTLGLMGYLALRHPGIRPWMVISAMLGGLIILWGTSQTGLGTQDLFAGRLRLQAYDNERFADIWLGLQVALQHPFGIGPGHFETYFATNNVHNLFIAKWTEAGFGPALAFVVLAVGSTCAARRAYNRSAAPLIGALYITLAVHLLASMFIYSHHWRHYLFLCVAAFVADRLAAEGRFNGPLSMGTPDD